MHENLSRAAEQRLTESDRKLQVMQQSYRRSAAANIIGAVYPKARRLTLRLTLAAAAQLDVQLTQMARLKCCGLLGCVSIYISSL